MSKDLPYIITIIFYLCPCSHPPDALVFSINFRVHKGTHAIVVQTIRLQGDLNHLSNITKSRKKSSSVSEFGSVKIFNFCSGYVKEYHHVCTAQYQQIPLAPTAYGAAPISVSIALGHKSAYAVKATAGGGGGLVHW